MSLAQIGISIAPSYVGLQLSYTINRPLRKASFLTVVVIFKRLSYVSFELL